MKTPILQTDRIILRPLTVEDANTVYENWTSDPRVARYMIWDLHESISDTIEWLTTVEQSNDSTDYQWGFVLKETGELFGAGSIHYRDDLGGYELGYNIMEKHWNKGLTTQAGRAIMDFAIDVLEEKKFFCNHAIENIGSKRVMEKLGFVYAKDGSYTSISGKKHFESKEYCLDL